MKPELRDQARNKWPSILSALGIGKEFLRDRHGPCPICGGKDRYRFDDKNGNGDWFCNICRAGDGVDLLMKTQGWTFAQAAENVRSVLGEATVSKPKPEITPARARQMMLDLWKSSGPIGDDEARAYLVNRGFLPPYSDALRFCASAHVSDHPTKTRLAAMLALVTGPDGKGVNLHRTFLENGGKANMPEPRRLMPGRLPDGSAIRLWPHEGRLGVAEGIETALAAHRDFGVPCWSTINTTLMAAFRVPDDVREFDVFGDNDSKFGGQAAAYTLAHRAATKRNAPTVEVHIPGAVSTDWADKEVRKHG